MASQLADMFVDFLVEVSTTDGDTTYVDTLLAAARASLSGSGAGLSQLISSGINGKTFTRAAQLTALEIAVACQRALRIYAATDENEISSTYADFSMLQH